MVKLSNASVHSDIIVEHERARECYNYVCVHFSVGLCQWIHVCVHMSVLVCVCVRQGVHICVTVSMCRSGVGVSCVLVCRRPWMLSRLQLETAVVHVHCRKDINLHLHQQQHEQQGDETGYRHVHPAWLSIITGSTSYF